MAQIVAYELWQHYLEMYLWALQVKGQLMALEYLTEQWHTQMWNFQGSSRAKIPNLPWVIVSWIIRKVATVKIGWGSMKGTLSLRCQRPDLIFTQPLVWMLLSWKLQLFDRMNQSKDFCFSHGRDEFETYWVSVDEPRCPASKETCKFPGICRQTNASSHSWNGGRHLFIFLRT